MVAQESKILSKQTVRGSALVTLSDIKNKASLCRKESEGVWRLGYATFVSPVRVYCVCLFY